MQNALNLSAATTLEYIADSGSASQASKTWPKTQQARDAASTHLVPLELVARPAIHNDRVMVPASAYQYAAAVAKASRHHLQEV